jgi:hypothetical protein
VPIVYVDHAPPVEYSSDTAGGEPILASVTFEPAVTAVSVSGFLVSSCCANSHVIIFTVS